MANSANPSPGLESGPAEARVRPDGARSPDRPELTLDGAFAPDEVDLTVIRWMLDRTPEERLQAVQDLIDATWALRGK